MLRPAKVRMRGAIERVVTSVAFVPRPDRPVFDAKVAEQRLTLGANDFFIFQEFVASISSFFSPFFFQAAQLQ